MSWRIVSVSSRSKLDYKMGYLVVRSKESTVRIHLSEISILMLESTAISLTAYLLRELERQKIDVVFCDETRTPYAMLSSLYLSEEELRLLYRSVFYEKLFVLLIEPCQRESALQEEQITIVDKDLCVLT